VLLPVGVAVGGLGLVLVFITIFFVGAPSRPCVPAEPCGPDQIASPLGAVIAVAGMCLLGPALWSRRLSMRLRFGAAGVAAALTAAGWVVFVGSL
jgi:hypothetical protein